MKGGLIGEIEALKVAADEVLILRLSGPEWEEDSAAGSLLDALEDAGLKGRSLVILAEPDSLELVAVKK